MANRIKSLQETRAAKVKELSQIRDAAKDATLTDEQRNKWDALSSEVDAISGDIDRELRAHSFENMEGKAFQGLSRDEQRNVTRMDWNKILNCMTRGRALDGIEAELAAEGEKEAREHGTFGSSQVYLPSFATERRDFTATGGTNLQFGGNTIETEKRPILDGFYNSIVLAGMGAQILTGLKGNFDWPLWVPDTDQAHKAENAAADKKNPTISTTSFSPKRLPAYVLLSDQLVIQSSDVIEAVIRRNLIEQTASAADRFAIAGTGTLLPVGILNTVGIGSVVGGTNGAVMDWTDILSLEEKVDAGNAVRESGMHYLTNGKVRAKLKDTPITLTSGNPVADGKILDWRMPNQINGYSARFSNNVPRTLTKGSATSICSAMIFGHFPDLVMAFWSGIGLEVVSDVDTRTKGQRALVMNVYHDSNVIRPASFAAMKDILTTGF
jgi:HK97 family phage major capsid protein